MTPPPEAPRARVGSWQGLLLFGVALAVRGSFMLEPPGRDQGLFWTQAELLLDGARLYEQVWEHKPPGIIALYAAARALSSSYVVIHVLNLIAVLSTALMLRVVLMRRGLSGAAALFASLVYLLYASGPAFGGFWMIAQPEVFLDPLLCAALLLLSASSLAGAALAGVAIGTAIAAIKYSALPWLVLAVLAHRRDATGLLRAHAARIAFLLGCALPPALIAAYFAATGRAAIWLDTTLAFNLEHARVGSHAFSEDPRAYAFPALISLSALYLLALAAFLERALRGYQRLAADTALRLGALLWLLGLLQVAMQGKYWTYHYHVILMPLAILAAVGFERLCARLAPRWGARRAAVGMSLVAVLASIGYFVQVGMYVDQHDLIAAMRGEISDDTFASRYAWGDHDYNFGIDRVVAAQIAKTTRPKDTIFIWGFEPVIYSLAQRKPATRFLYDYPLMARFSHHAQRETQLLADLRAHPPALILVLRADQNDLESEDSTSQLAAMPRLSAYLERGYRPTWNVYKFACYVRR